MTHLDEEQAQRLRHGELPAPAEAAARAHLTACADCRQRLAQAEREEGDVDALLRHLDHPPPAIEAGAVAARAGVREFGWGRWAAGILLTLGLAGAAYAAPGSPLPAWVTAVAEWMGGGSARPPSAPAPSPAPLPPPSPGFAGIAVAPGRALLIHFTSPQAKGWAQVSLTDGGEVVVRALNGAATYTSDDDRLVIDNRGSAASFEIEVPRVAPWVEIRVDRVRVFLKDGPRVTTRQAPDTLGRYLLPLVPEQS